eukprot:364381-Chlamydomonas_euryale.AAC.4
MQYFQHRRAGGGGSRTAAVAAPARQQRRCCGDGVCACMHMGVCVDANMIGWAFLHVRQHASVLSSPDAVAWNFYGK